MNTLRIGTNLKKAAREDYFQLAKEFGICEIVPENWDPRRVEDRAFLQRLSDVSEILLHSLSMNVLGSGLEYWVLERILFWVGDLKINSVSDHFSWTGIGKHRLGIFLPPIEDFDTISEKVGVLKSQLNTKLALENIAIPSSSVELISAYHHTFLKASVACNFELIVDVENIRLDALSSGMPLDSLTSMYEDHLSSISYYHIAGSEADPSGKLADTHSGSISEEALSTLDFFLEKKQAPIIYERDYNISIEEIGVELAKLRRHQSM